MFKPSKYQEAIFEFIKNGVGSAVIEAVAGSGKSTTIVNALEMIPVHHSVVFLAFNKSIVEELRTRVPAHINVATLNSLGHRAWMKHVGQVKLDSYKTQTIVRKSMDPEAKKYEREISRLVGLAKAMGMAPDNVPGVSGLYTATFDRWLDLAEEYDVEFEEGTTGKVIQYAQEALFISVQMKNVIDFDDQMYLPVVYNISMTKYQWVFIDEAQDVSPIQRAMVSKSVSPKGRLIAVGDSRQAIYAFRGADHSSMDQITKDFNAVTLPLSISYRCPKSVVALAKGIVPQIECAETAIEGSVVQHGTIGDKFDLSNFTSSDMVICRNNAPLIRVAYQMITRRISCNIRGRDIGAGLVAVIKKVKARSIDGLPKAIALWAESEKEKALAKGLDGKVGMINDKAECLDVIVSSTKVKTIEQLCAEIESLFGGNGGVTLSSIHRAKGLEADNVYVLDQHLMPSKFARSQSALKQEYNLMYVAYTRAKKNLGFINSPSKDD